MRGRGRGWLYGDELQKTEVPDLLLIDKVLRTRTRAGQKELYFKYLGWPDRFNRWIPATDVVEDFGNQPVATRCKGVTASGQQCKRMATNANGYCEQHQDQAP